MGVITIGIIGYIGYRTMYGRMPSNSEQGTSAPKQQLDNVRGAARRIETAQDKAAEQALENSRSE